MSIAKILYVKMLACGMQDAAREKAAAGEGRNVEHVAEANDITHAAVGSRKRGRKPVQKAEAKHDGEAEQSKRTTRKRKAQ